MTCKRLVWNLGVLALSHWVNAKVLADAPRNRIVVPRPHQAKHFQKPNAPYSQKFANKQGSNFAAPAKPSKTFQNPFCRFDTVIPKDVSKYYTKNHTTRWHLYRLLLIVSLPAMWGSLDFNKTPRTHTHHMPAISTRLLYSEFAGSLGLYKPEHSGELSLPVLSDPTGASLMPDTMPQRKRDAI